MRLRLVDHYGEAVEPWLDGVGVLLDEAARRHELRNTIVHDRGHASVVAYGRTSAGSGLVLKAVYEWRRLEHEAAALNAWNGCHTAGLVAVHDDLGILVTELVEPGPGGARRPTSELLDVVHALGDLHQSPTATVPTLATYCTEIAERMAQRDQATCRQVDRALIAEAGDLAGELPRHGPPRLLHGDLYRENTLFDTGGRVVFIDPLPMIGDPAYDWAFWTVYYDLHQGFHHRLRLAKQACDPRSLAAWCRLLAVDGLLYFLSIKDEKRARRARQIVDAIRPPTIATDHLAEPPTLGAAPPARPGLGDLTDLTEGFRTDA